MTSKRLVKLNAPGPGAQFIYTDESGRFVVEWYDFGEDVPYEFANMLILSDSQLAAVAERLGLGIGAEQQQIATEMADRLGSYFAIRGYLDRLGLPYTHEVDFQP